MRFDMHCHTKEGSPDGHVTLIEYTELLKEKGYQGMLICDHNSYKAYRYYKKELQGKTDFVILKGIEYDTLDAGHILVILPKGVHLPLLEYRGLKTKELIQIVHRHGGILGPAHPCGEMFLSFCRSLLYHRDRSILKSFDFMETFNACESERSNQKAAKLAKLFHLCPLGGSDSHKLEGVGFGYTDFTVPILNESDLIAAIKGHKVSRAFGQIFHGTLKDRLGIFNYLLVYGFWPYNKAAAFYHTLRKHIFLSAKDKNV